MLPGWIWFVLTLGLLALVTLIAPAEKTLGSGARLVYLHGALVWSAILAFTASGISGLVMLLARKPGLFAWSQSLARTGLTLWLVQLPMSLLVMQLNWGGLFLDEPRWRTSLTLAIVGLLVQVGLALFAHPGLSMAANVLYAALLLFSLNNLVSVMHPDSPILQSSAAPIQIFFAILVVLNCLVAAQIARFWKTGRFREI